MNTKEPITINHRLMLPVVLFMMSLSVGCGHKEDSAEPPANTKYSTLAELERTAERAGAPVSETTSENTASSAILSSESKDAVVIEFKFAFKEPFEGIVLKNHRLRQYVYEQLGKEDDAPLYEEELEAYRGLFRKPDYYSFTISCGQELDFVRTYFDLNSFYDFSITFTPDLHDWTDSQLEGLKDLQKPVRISGTEDTIPAEVLVYFTGTDELIFDNIADVTGTLPPGRAFPDTVREVSILSYRRDTPCTFENLLACMQDSNVQHLYIPDYSNDLSCAFPLDAVAGMKALVSLDLNGGRIRVENKECLSESSLRALTNFILDRETDTSIFQMLPQLNRIVCDVAADADLSFLSEDDTLSVRLFFCPPMIEFPYDSPLYPDCTPAVFPALDDALGWREDGDENNFLAIYQRLIDEGRSIECFSIRYLTGESASEDYRLFRPMQNDRTFLRVTDGEQVQFLLPGQDDPDINYFGDYQTDYAHLGDINFDGINDIMLDTGTFGNSGYSFTFGWIYDTASNTYLLSDSFSNIVNPFVDSKHQLIRSAWRNTAVSHGLATYRYDEVTGDYRKERQLIEDDMTHLASDFIPDLQTASELIPDLQMPENSTLWGYEETIYAEDGTTALERDIYYVLDAPGYPTEYLDAYYNFHGPGSYWEYE